MERKQNLKPACQQAGLRTPAPLERGSLSKTGRPAPLERGSPSPTFAPKVGLGRQISNPNLKSQNKFKLKAQSAKRKAEA